MNLEELRNQLREFLGFDQTDEIVNFETVEISEEETYTRIRITFSGLDGDQIPAFLLLPRKDPPLAAVLAHHQHNSQRHLGKSEVCGLEGDPHQFFGPALAKQGIAVLAPDSICFEDRRKNRAGTQPDEPADVEQHYNEMCYRLLRDDTLMRKVLSDSARAISLMKAHPLVDAHRIGILGHSYGGNTVLFHGALDDRISFACASGAACSYDHKMAHQIGIEMAEVIPGFVTHFDIPDLVACFAPRHLLLVSATEDKFSQDADSVVEIAREKCATAGIAEHIEHLRYEGGHALTEERFDSIVNWIADR